MKILEFGFKHITCEGPTNDFKMIPEFFQFVLEII